MLRFRRIKLCYSRTSCELLRVPASQFFNQRHQAPSSLLTFANEWR